MFYSSIKLYIHQWRTFTRRSKWFWQSNKLVLLIARRFNESRSLTPRLRKAFLKKFLQLHREVLRTDRFEASA